MPALLHPIGTRVHHNKLGDGIIIGYKYPNQPVLNYHTYFYNKGIRLFKQIRDMRIFTLPNVEMTTAEQNIVLDIQTDEAPSYARLKRGTVLINHKDHLPDLEYIVLDNGHIHHNGYVYYLEAFHEIGKSTWFVDYFDEPETIESTPFMKIQPPTPASIQQANILFFEHIIIPAFTTI